MIPSERLTPQRVAQMFDAIHQLQLMMEGWGIPLPAGRMEWKKSESFAKSLLLCTTPTEAQRLCSAHPKAASAFYAILDQLREELDESGDRLAKPATVGLQLYEPAASAVLLAAAVYRHGMTFREWMIQTGVDGLS